MSAPFMKRASLAEIKERRDRGELHHDPNAPEAESLGAEFWAKARIVERARPRSVHLKLDPDVFDFFHSEAGGKGHLTKMQAVLKAYVAAHRQSRTGSR
jgi:uncharacterized protein (DUF4415 family)